MSNAKKVSAFKLILNKLDKLDKNRDKKLKSYIQSMNDAVDKTVSEIRKLNKGDN